jgi:hypothetical protein
LSFIFLLRYFIARPFQQLRLSAVTRFKPFLERVTAGEAWIIFTAAMMLVAKGDAVEMRPLFCLAIDVVHLSRRMHGELS